MSNNECKSETKSKSNRCAFCECNKKLKLTDLVCKCGYIYCSIHRLPEQHECKYSYKENFDKQKEIDKMKCISDKIDRF